MYSPLIAHPRRSTVRPPEAGDRPRRRRRSARRRAAARSRGARVAARKSDDGRSSVIANVAPSARSPLDQRRRSRDRLHAVRHHRRPPALRPRPRHRWQPAARPASPRLAPRGTLVIVGGEEGGRWTGGNHRQLGALSPSRRSYESAPGNVRRRKPNRADLDTLRGLHRDPRGDPRRRPGHHARPAPTGDPRPHRRTRPRQDRRRNVTPTQPCPLSRRSRRFTYGGTALRGDYGKPGCPESTLIDISVPPRAALATDSESASVPMSRSPRPSPGLSLRFFEPRTRWSRSADRSSRGPHPGELDLATAAELERALEAVLDGGGSSAWRSICAAWTSSPPKCADS